MQRWWQFAGVVLGAQSRKRSNLNLKKLINWIGDKGSRREKMHLCISFVLYGNFLYLYIFSQTKIHDHHLRKTSVFHATKEKWEKSQMIMKIATREEKSRNYSRQIKEEKKCIKWANHTVRWKKITNYFYCSLIIRFSVFVWSSY